MYYGIYNTKGLYSSPIKGFLGLNRKKKGNAGECVDCKNVSGDEFPVLRSIPENLWILEQEGISKMLPPDEGRIKSFTGIADGKLYIDGQEKTTTSDENVLKNGEYFFLTPSATVYDKKINKKTSWGRDSCIMSSKLKNFKTISPGGYLVNIKNPGVEFVKDTDNISKIFYGEKIKYIYLKSSTQSDYLQKEFGWESNGDYFLVGDGTVINNEEMRVSITYYKKNDNGEFETALNEELYSFITNYGNEAFNIINIALESEFPDVACIYKNRVWSGTADGSKVMVSKQGHLNVFSDFSSGAASSWYCEVGSDGKFTGITSYNDAVYAFKEECVHVIYGNIPANFSMDKTFNECGCIDGRSIITVNNALYWLGYGGIYRYAGGTPKIISDNLNRKYKECISFSDNRKLYLNLTDYDGNHELISFDTEKGLWHKHKYSNFLGGFMHEGRLYAYTKSGCYEIGNGGYGEWYFEGVTEYNDTFLNHSAIEFFVRAELKAGSSIKVEYKGISQSDWENCGEYIAEKDEMIKERFIARLKNDTAYQYRLSGVGEVYIYELEKGVQQSGKKNV